MLITKVKENDKLIIYLDGRLDVLTSNDLTKEIEEIPDDVMKLIIDIEKIEYISSAGLRTILLAYRKMSGDKKFILKNPKPNIVELLKLTKFCNILTIEND